MRIKRVLCHILFRLFTSIHVGKHLLYYLPFNNHHENVKLLLVKQFVYQNETLGMKKKLHAIFKCRFFDKFEQMFQHCISYKPMNIELTKVGKI